MNETHAHYFSAHDHEKVTDTVFIPKNPVVRSQICIGKTKEGYQLTFNVSSRFNRFQKFMIKKFFGFDVKDV